MARATAPLRIDGRLDEALWASAEPATSFTQLVLTEGSPASERTEIRFLFDEAALYVGTRMHDRGAITTRLGRGDRSMQASDGNAIRKPQRPDRVDIRVGFAPLTAGRARLQRMTRRDDD